MGIIVKFILRNVYEKKVRTSLILFSIIIATALFFASQAIGNTMVKMYEDRIKQFYGQTDILIQPGSESASQFLSMDKAKKYSEKAEYIVGLTQTTSFYRYKGKENVAIDLLGVEINDLDLMNPINFESKSMVEPFKGQKIVISKNTADKYKLYIGNKMEFYINGVKKIFQICGISNPTGILTDDGRTIRAVVPKEAMLTLLRQNNKANIICIKLKDKSKIPDMIKTLSNEYPKDSVTEPISKQDLEKELGTIATPFLLMSIIVSFMSIYIIYSTFKVITIERIPIVGTFRSIGATRKMTDIVLIAESACYGIIGGVLGCGLGIGILYLMSYLTRPVWEKGFKATINFSPAQLLGAFIAALALSVISSMIPIIRVSKTPVKEIIMGTFQNNRKKKRWKLVLAVMFLATALILPNYIPKEFGMLVDTVCMLFTVFSAILFIPYINKIYVLVVEKVFGYILGNEGSLAAKNLRDNKGILGSISLLVIGISSLFMINTISYSVLTEVSKVFSNGKFDIMMVSDKSDNSYINKVSEVKGVSGVYGSYESNGIEISGEKDKLTTLDGINKRFFDYWDYSIPGGINSAINELNEQRTIIVTNTVKEKYDLKAGEMISLKMKTGYKKYKVSDKFFDTMWNNGQVGFISEKYYKEDLDAKYYTQMYVRSSEDPAKVVENIKNETFNKIYFISSLKELEKMNNQSNSQMFSILKGFAFLTLIIGVFGVINNLLISFMERRRSIAMFKSIGMSRKQVIKMIFTEAVAGGFLGGIIGVACGMIMLYIVPFVLKAMELPVPIDYSIGSVLFSFVLGVLIMVIASISPALKSSRLNIIGAIKYE